MRCKSEVGRKGLEEINSSKLSCWEQRSYATLGWHLERGAYLVSRVDWRALFSKRIDRLDVPFLAAY